MSKISYQIESKCTIRFIAFNIVFTGQYIVSYCDIVHHLSSLFSNLSLLLQIIVSNSVKMQQSPSLFSHFQGKDGLRHAPLITTCTDFLIAVSNIFSNSDRMHTYSVLVFIFSLQFQIVSNTVTHTHAHMHASTVRSTL